VTLPRRCKAGLWVGGILSLLVPSTIWHSAPPTGKHEFAAGSDASCRACHPGATKQLRASPHAFLLTDDSHRATSCSSCHGDLSSHTAAAVDRRDPLPPVPLVSGTSCTSCHDSGREVTTAAHAETAKATAPPAPVQPIPQSESEREGGPEWLGLEWSSLLTAGYRFVNQAGSTDRYETDLNLSSGLRLIEGEVEGTSVDGGDIDLFRVSAFNIGDPYQRVDARAEKRGSYRGNVEWRRQIVKYLASGDYHHVDQNTEEANFLVGINATDDLEVFASYRRYDRDAFWLTNRIAGRNVQPQRTISNVASPRELSTDEYELGLTGSVAQFNFTISADYRDDRLKQRWTYSQPAPINPAFNESQDFATRSKLYGPGGRLLLQRDFGPLSIDFSGRVLSLDRDISSNGVGSGYDISNFDTATYSSGGGSALTWLGDLSATLSASDWLTVLADLRFIDHDENMQLDQTTTTSYPTLGVTPPPLVSNVDNRTHQRTFEGSVQLDAEPTEGLLFSVGYGWSREAMELPDLESGDFDEVSGTVTDNGVILGAQWRPSTHWTLSLRHREYGQSGLELYDIIAQTLRGSEVRLRYHGDGVSIDSFLKYRHADNDIADMRSDVVTAGLSSTWWYDEDVSFFASYVVSDIDSQTLTNFYFDPDPDPVPTYVGFEGLTHTITAGFDLRPSSDILWHTNCALTDTTGSFDVQLWDISTDLSVRVLAGGEAGVQVRWVDYNEAGGLDDYSAVLTMIYWRQRLGAPRR